MTKEHSQDLDEVYLSEKSVEYMKQYDIDFDYDFGKFLGIFLRGGTFKQPLKRSINFHICGYGRDFAKEVREFLLTYLRKKGINCIYTMNPDSSETIDVENNLIAVFLSHFLIRNNKLVVDNIIKHSHKRDFILGIVDILNEDADNIFSQDGTKLSFEEEDRFWSIV